MNRSQTLPQYLQVADTLRRRIRNGVYRGGEVLPPAAELERIFEVSGITIRKALGVLAAAGRVSGRRGVGTLVHPDHTEERVAIQVSGNFREWLASASGQNRLIEQEVLDIQVGPGPPPVAHRLGFPDDQPLWCMRRIRRINGVPISYHVNYGAPDRFSQVREATMAPKRSFVEVVRGNLGIVLERLDQSVEAIVADRDLAGLLEIDFGEPLFFVENVYTAESDTVVLVTHLYLRGDRYVYRSSIKLEDADQIPREATDSPLV